MHASVPELHIRTFCTLGTIGKCPGSLINGATLFVALELGNPGVPPAAGLAVQFWPVLLWSCGLINSSECPAPSAAQVQVQPR